MDSRLGHASMDSLVTPMIETTRQNMITRQMPEQMLVADRDRFFSNGRRQRLNNRVQSEVGKDEAVIGKMVKRRSCSTSTSGYLRLEMALHRLAMLSQQKRPWSRHDVIHQSEFGYCNPKPEVYHRTTS
jgi:hypothetical protein